MKTEAQPGRQLPSVLAEILERKREEIEAMQPPERMQAAQAPGRFRRAISEGAAPRLIAEIKRRSPSAGWIREGADPVEIGRGYERAGAAAISVLTDTDFFGGSMDDLRRVRSAVGLPILRKDFILDTRQIDEACDAGADAVLLIVAALTGRELRALHDHAGALGLDVLVEVHDRREMERALEIGADIIGVNSRDLRTFEVRREIIAELSDLVPPEVVLVAESGVSGPADVRWIASATKAAAVLVGGALMAAPDPAAAAAGIVNAARPSASA